MSRRMRLAWGRHCDDEDLAGFARGRLLGGVLVAFAAVSFPAFSQTVHNVQVTRLTPDSTLRKGGSSGSQYNLSCSDGEVLVGVNARAGNVVDRVQGVCTRVTSTGAWTGSLRFTGSAGGSGGSTRNRRCPSGYALSGFSGRSGSLIDRLVLECTRLSSDGSFNTNQRQNLAGIGGSGGTAFSKTRCSRPARSIVGKSSAFIHSFELACESRTPEMTRGQIDAALNGADSILRQDSGANDVACDVDLRRSGRVRIEPSNGLWNVSSSSEMNRACDLLGFAVVTDRITYCSGIGSSIIGCARPGCMVVVPFGSGVNRNQLWAHEFGHTRALPHRSGSNNIMNPSVNGGTGVNSSECGNYRNPVLSFFFGFLPAEEQAAENLSLQEFVSQAFIHGVPFEQAVAYGPSAVPELIKILKDPKQAANWSNAATMLAMIDEPSGVDAVIDFIEDSDTEEDSPEAWARGNAMLSLGYSASKGSNKKAMQYLEESLEPGIWQKRKVLVDQRQGLRLYGSCSTPPS